MLSPSQRRERLLSRFPSWPGMTLGSLQDLATAAWPERPMILGTPKCYTYSACQTISRSMASGLISLGLQPGDRVALVMANHPEFVLAKLAIARAGCVAVPVNFLLQRDELLYILEQSGSRALIGMTHLRDRDYIADHIAARDSIAALEFIILHGAIPDTAPPILCLDALTRLATPASDMALADREQTASADNCSDIIYTSGTTGRPKGALLTHDMVLRAAFSSALTRSFEEGRRIQFALPMYHVFGYVECWVAAMFVGGAIIPHTIFDPAEMLDWAERFSANDIVCVPVMTQMLVETAKDRGFNAASLFSVFNSGGSNPASIWQDIRSVLGTREIHTAYGMTETTASAMCTLTEDDDARLILTNGRAKLAGPAGDPRIGGLVAQYRVVDTQTGLEMPLGKEGELHVRGPIVTQGYYGKPEETAEAFTADGWFRTGDLGALDAEGYLRLTGRIKETYRCGGEMVMPREIEQLLENFPGIAQVLAVGVPHPRMGETGCLCIVAKPGQQPDSDAILAHCAANLAKFKVPRHVLLIDAKDIPLTATGRPQRFKLAQWARQQLDIAE